MELNEWIRKEGRKINWIATQINIPISVLYAYSSNLRALPEKYIHPIIELTNGECTEEDLRRKKRQPHKGLDRLRRIKTD